MAELLRGRRWLVDVAPLRASRDLRLILAAELVVTLGTQAILVAVPYQIYTLTHSALAVGLIGAVELAPLVTMALLGGAIADRVDRRRLLLAGALLLGVAASTLAALSWDQRPPVAEVYVLAGVIAGAGSALNAAATAIVPGTVGPDRLRSALALAFGLTNLAQVVGPGLGGLLIAGVGLGPTYAVAAGAALLTVAAVPALSPQRPPPADVPHPSVLTSVRDGLRFVRGERALVGSFAIDLLAMTFGMPRALFAVLSLTVYHAGAQGTGLLYAAVSFGAVIAAFTTGWLEHARRLGRIVIGAVLVWGVCIAFAGAAGSLALAAVMLALAGAADSVSAVCRSTINQTITPEAMRARMSSVFIVVVTSGPRLGDIESGSVAGLAGARFSVISGGLACVLGIGAILLAFPELARYDGGRATK
ncbi:MAG TPA: MFS transporter [Solirubrobacteraceae bacterium]|nr:MFS transporter [Solirubrobacteraceae bacterium]